ncbi:MAG TPA: phospholipase D-like domain-containing protein [Pirellulales bacterium]|jgi:cardiolipin synthase|nr:phospholipase D-like domain-containing protein [Pirellulales bacterium]
MSILEVEKSGEACPAPHPAIWSAQVNGHQLQIFAEFSPLLTSILADVQAARRRIWVESYIFAADPAGAALSEALKAKARAGLDVRVVYDAVGCMSTPAAFFAEMVAAGVRVHGFHKVSDALWRLPRFFQIFNRRNHRKLLVVDDHVAYFGGMNLVDHGGSFAATLGHVPAANQLPPWRDVHVRLVGPQQALVVQAMQALWNRLTGLRAGPSPWSRRRMLRSRRDGLYLFDCSPGLKNRRAARVLVPLVRKARRSITISVAYFIPEGPVFRALLRARRRGVKVRVLVPAISDVPPAHWACRHCYDRLVSAGIRLYERQDLMLHSKVLVIDDQWSVIGSCNLDPRSLQWNLEFVGVVRSAAVARVLTRICAYELRCSRRVTDEHCRRRTWWQRLRDWLAWSFRRWL